MEIFQLPLLKTDSITAFKDITPQAPTHVLIIPNKHFENMAEVANADADLAGQIFKVAGEIAHELGLKAIGPMQTRVWRLGNQFSTLTYIS